MPHPERIIVGLSGGVDSAVAALLLLRAGHDVTGVFMKNWEEDDADGHCPAAEDLAAAQAVCGHLGIELLTVSFADRYWDRVFEHFLAEYRAGRTPNPDVLCNREIKFRAFLDHALGLGAGGIATGHYARIDAGPGGRRLLRGADADKDQTYFLHALDQNQLAHSRFPLGGLRKAEVRRLARAAGLANHDRRDSTGICFIGERRFSEFLARYIPAQPGEIRDLDDRVLGEHRGLMFYTLGQRQGLGIGGRRDGGGAPWYVVDKELESNVLRVAQGADHPRLYSTALVATGLHWIAGRPPALPLTCQARIRHRQPLQGCTVEAVDGAGCRVRFDHPQKAVTPGQAVVFYTGEECLGGGTISAGEAAA